MKTPSLYSTTLFLAVLAMLLFSSTSYAHSSFSHSKSHARHHHGYEINTYVIATSNGLARNYFNYGYEQRRAKTLAKYYRVNKPVLKKLKKTHRYKHAHYHDYNHHYDDCPYTDHRH